jgi:cell division septation protein DedD
MRGVFDEKDLDRDGQRRDTELTLNPTTLLGIFFGMVLLCGLFFGLGFAVGRYGPSDSPSGQQVAASTQPPPLAASSKPKPSAVPQTAPEPQRVVVRLPAAAASTVPTASLPPVNSTPASPYAQPQVRPALAPSEYEPPAQPAATSRVEPATAPVAGMMVQIAAVMHPEDAEVLVGALRKRGYAVSVRRLPTDNLIHVQIGPFKSRDEANRWRQKLLNDGYNAILQP